jgi:hypothetical protein
MKQTQFFIFGGTCDTYLHVVEDCGPIFTHFGYRHPTPYAELSTIEYERKYPRSNQKFNKVSIDLDKVGVIECYLLENDYEYYLIQHLKSEIKSNNIQTQEELISWVNSQVLKYVN